MCKAMPWWHATADSTASSCTRGFDLQVALQNAVKVLHHLQHSSRGMQWLCSSAEVPAWPRHSEHKHAVAVVMAKTFLFLQYTA